MGIQNHIRKIIKSGSSEDAFLLAVSFKEARNKEIFEVISEDTDSAFKSLRMIPEAASHSCIIKKVIAVPKYARFIVDNFKKHRNENIFRAAIDTKLWAIFYRDKYQISYKWLDEMINIKDDSKSLVNEEYKEVIDLY